LTEKTKKPKRKDKKNGKRKRKNNIQIQPCI